jgi:XTP/dITP diphosphohydrolase
MDSKKEWKILLCSTNPGKIMEVKRLIETHFKHITLQSPRDIGVELEVEEDGKTLAENAIKKILAYLDHEVIRNSPYNWIILGDDTGLEIESLGGTIRTVRS